MKHPLARALASVGLNTTDVAARLGVDPKTVGRWLGGRVPYPRHRAGLVEMTGWTTRDLWPELTRPPGPDSTAREIRVAYPHRSAVPADAWRRHFAKARHQIGVLAYSALFLAEDAAAQRLLREKARSGARVRVALGDPAGEHLARRGAEEGIHDLMIARVQNALILFQPLAEQPGAEIRLHDSILYNSIYRADDEILVNSHVYGSPASHTPVLHIHRINEDGIASRYLESFERIWSSARKP